MPDEPLVPATVAQGPSGAELAELMAFEERVERRVRLRRIAMIAGALSLLVVAALFVAPAVVAARFEERHLFLAAFEAENAEARCCVDEQLASCMSSVRQLIKMHRSSEGFAPIESLVSMLAPVLPLQVGDNPRARLHALFQDCPTAQHRAKVGTRMPSVFDR